VVTVSRRQALLLVVGLLGVLALVGSRLARTGASEGPVRAGRLTQAVPGASSVAPKLVVHVVGAIHRPGLYRLGEGARVADALERAGGALARADLAAVNLAAPLADGQQVIVPQRAPPGTAGVVPGAPATPAGGRVSLATATIEQLDTLPGIGPVTAQKIVDWRTTHGPFRSVDDLDQIPGIGPARVEQLRDLVTP
jgi:competence protein ComEA